MKNALALDPGALGPLFAIVNLYASEGEYAMCIKLMEEGTKGGRVNDMMDASSAVVASTSSHVVTWNKEHGDVMQAKLAEIQKC